jgi:hypothetical protein
MIIDLYEFIGAPYGLSRDVAPILRFRHRTSVVANVEWPLLAGSALAHINLPAILVAYGIVYTHMFSTLAKL